jgi:hypothetical protein
VSRDVAIRNNVSRGSITVLPHSRDGYRSILWPTSRLEVERAQNFSARAEPEL